MTRETTIDIVSVTRNDLDGIQRTLTSARLVRRVAAERGVKMRQFVIDGSSLEIAAEVQQCVAGEPGDVAYHHLPPNGISAAFNFGIQQSQADWIWILNGGDEVLPDAPLSVLFEVSQRTASQVIIFSGNIQGVRQHTRPLAKLWPLVYCWIIHNAALVRRDVMNEFGGYREDYKIAMDAELWIRIFGYYKQADVIDIPLIHFEGGGVSDDVLGRAPESKRMLWDNKRLLYARLFDYPKICWEAWRTYCRNEKALRKRERSK
jgi:hypothetical protein